MAENKKKKEGNDKELGNKDKSKKKKEDTTSNVILMGAPAAKKELPKTEKPKTQMSVHKDDAQKTKSDEQKPIEIINNASGGNGGRHMNLGRAFFLLSILFLLYLALGSLFDWFGDIDIAFLSFWPLLFIFLGLLLFKVKTTSGKILGLLVVVIVLTAALGILFRGGELIDVQLAGETTVEERTIDEFSSIIFEGVGSVVIEQGDETSLVVEGDESLLEQVETNVKDRTLSISYKSALWKVLLFDEAGIEITITTPNVDELHLLGSGTIAADSLETETLLVSLSGSGSVIIDDISATQVSSSISGSGNITIGGNTALEAVAISGSGDYEAFELRSEEVGARISGSGTVNVNVSKLLDVAISGTGRVVYKGNPTLKEGKISGSGTLEAFEDDVDEKSVDPKEFYEKVKPVF